MKFHPIVAVNWRTTMYIHMNVQILVKGWQCFTLGWWLITHLVLSCNYSHSFLFFYNCYPVWAWTNRVNNNERGGVWSLNWIKCSWISSSTLFGFYFKEIHALVGKTSHPSLFDVVLKDNSFYRPHFKGIHMYFSNRLCWLLPSNQSYKQMVSYRKDAGDHEVHCRPLMKAGHWTTKTSHISSI